MEKYLLTYEDALQICKRYENGKAACSFWESQYMIDGYKLSTFNYFICGWNDFANPLIENNVVNAFDMRGTTFVFNKDGSLYDRFFMLPKFFNLNQVESTQYNIIKNKKIESITIKEDGSLVAFMMLPNEKLFAKTIGSFVSEQAKNALTILYKNKIHVNWVKKVLKIGYTPLFEYVSWDNRIVLSYKEPQIRLIGFRDNLLGNYYPAGGLLLPELKNIPQDIYTILSENYSLDELIEKSKVEKNKEGWVVKFVDGQLIKIKTNWYFAKHNLRTESVFREDYIIKHYLEETLDDIITQLDKIEDKDALNFIDSVICSINKYINYIDNCVKSLKEKYINEFNSNWNEYAKFSNKEAFFGLSKYFFESEEEYRKRKINMILKSTNKLNTAKDLISKWKLK